MISLRESSRRLKYIYGVIEMDKKVIEEILKVIKGELEFDDDYGYICVDGTNITVRI